MPDAAAHTALVTADSYALWRQSALGAITERIEIGLVFDLAGALAGARVLDVGCGDGAYALEAAARGGRVTALDAEPGMLDAARARAAVRGLEVHFRLGRAEALPFADGAFDLVLAVTVLCLVSDAALAVREMARVLRPGGRVVLGELGRYSLWAAERRVRAWWGDPLWRQARFWSRRELARLTGAAALQVLKSRGAIYYPPSGALARALAPLDPALSRLGIPGGAFLALAAEKRSERA